MSKFVTILDTYKYTIGIIALLGIEIAPIKINPIKWFFKKLDKLLHGELYESIEKLSKRFDEKEKKDDLDKVIDIKNRLVSYKVMLVNQGLDEDQYRRCFELIDKYRHYKKVYGNQVNGHMDAIIDIIETKYKQGEIKIHNKQVKK